MLQLISASEEATRVSAARVLGVALKFNPDAAFQSILETEILAEPGNVGADVVHGRCLALGQVLRYNAERCAASHAAIIDRIRAYLKSDSLMVRKAAISDCKYVLNAYALLSEADKVEITEGCEVDARAGRAFERSLAVHL